MIHDQHQMSRHSYTAGEPWGRSHVEALGAGDQRQDRSPSRRAGYFDDSRTTRLASVATGARHLIQFAIRPAADITAGRFRRPLAGAGCDVDRQPIPVRSCVPSRSLSARWFRLLSLPAGRRDHLNLRCAFTSRSRSFLACVPQHVSRQTPDAAKRHLKRLSTLVVAYDEQLTERGCGRVPKSPRTFLNSRGELPNVVD